MNIQNLEDLNTNSLFDIVIESYPVEEESGSICLDVEKTGLNKDSDTLLKLIERALLTKRGDWKNDPFFGASPRQYTTLMTPNGLAQLASKIKLDLKTSGIDNPLDVKIIPVSLDSIALNINVMPLILVKSNRVLAYSCIYNTSSQALTPVIGFNS